MSTFEIIEVPTTTVAVVRREVPLAEMTEFFGSAFEQVAQAVAAAQGAIVGPPFGWYHGLDTDPVDLSAGFPVSGVAGTPDAQVRVVRRPGGRVAVGMHVGPYDQLERTYRELESWLGEHGLSTGEEMWEEYLSLPEGDPATWQTRVVAPLV